jgi:hypothetical protein
MPNMCYGCWEEQGSPKIDTPEIRALAELSLGVDPFGGFHIAVEDWNLEDDDLTFCIDYETSVPHEVEWGRRMLALRVDERFSVLALADKFWEPLTPPSQP